MIHIWPSFRRQQSYFLVSVQVDSHHWWHTHRTIFPRQEKAMVMSSTGSRGKKRHRQGRNCTRDMAMRLSPWVCQLGTLKPLASLHEVAASTQGWLGVVCAECLGTDITIPCWISPGCHGPLWEKNWQYAPDKSRDGRMQLLPRAWYSVQTDSGTPALSLRSS